MKSLWSNVWLWVMLGWTATGIVAGHYLVAKFDLFTEGIALMMRYIIGTLTWLVPLTIFLVEVLRAPAFAEIVWAFVIVAGATDLAVYLLDERDMIVKFVKWLREKLRIA